ncbi:hypothetical protein H6792_00390 [Candidatus Nomurabacteria bacterium]|nr:hypothetical protein [Candidatus Nomurabacteria bacterium]
MGRFNHIVSNNKRLMFVVLAVFLVGLGLVSGSVIANKSAEETYTRSLGGILFDSGVMLFDQSSDPLKLFPGADQPFSLDIKQTIGDNIVGQEPLEFDSTIYSDPNSDFSMNVSSRYADLDLLRYSDKYYLRTNADFINYAQDGAGNSIFTQDTDDDSWISLDGNQASDIYPYIDDYNCSLLEYGNMVKEFTFQIFLDDLASQISVANQGTVTIDGESLDRYKVTISGDEFETKLRNDLVNLSRDIDNCFEDNYLSKLSFESMKLSPDTAAVVYVDHDHKINNILLDLNMTDVAFEGDSQLPVSAIDTNDTSNENNSFEATTTYSELNYRLEIKPFDYGVKKSIKKPTQIVN